MTKLTIFELNIMTAFFCLQELIQNHTQKSINKRELCNKCAPFMKRIHADQTSKALHVYCYVFHVDWFNL